MEPRAFQDQIGDNHCWGCGPTNARGLRIKSYWSGDESVCTWQPNEYHMAGPPHVLNGGIIASIIDCHCICTAIAVAYKAESRPIGSGPPIWYVTASLQVTYLLPTPVSGPVVLSARVKERGERKTVLTCSVSSGEEERASGELVAVRVEPEWAKSGQS